MSNELYILEDELYGGCFRCGACGKRMILNFDMFLTDERNINGLKDFKYCPACGNKFERMIKVYNLEEVQINE